MPIGRYIGASAVALLAIGAFGVYSAGFPLRFTEVQQRVLRYNAATVAEGYGEHSCLLEPDEPFNKFDRRRCATVDPQRINILLAGDSTAAHYASAFREHLDPTKYNLLQLTSAGCPPFLGESKRASQNCDNANQAFETLLIGGQLSVVILSAHWNAYAFNDRGQIPSGSRPYTAGLKTIFEAKLDATLSKAEAEGVPLLLLGPSVEFSSPLAPAVARAETSNMPLPSPAGRLFQTDDQLKRLAGRYRNVHFISVTDALCKDAICTVKADADTPIVWDTIHLTPEGSRLVLSRIGPQLDTFLASIDVKPIAR